MTLTKLKSCVIIIVYTDNFSHQEGQEVKVKTTYISDITGKEYGSEEELKREEKAFKEAEKAARAKAEEKEREQKITERTTRAKEIEEAYKDFKDFQTECSKKIQEKWDNFVALRNSFIEDYGEYHTTYRTILKPFSFANLFDELFRF